jgi:hypothetical protein
MLEAPKRETLPARPLRPCSGLEFRVYAGRSEYRLQPGQKLLSTGRAAAPPPEGGTPNVHELPAGTRKALNAPVARRKPRRVFGVGRKSVFIRVPAPLCESSRSLSAGADSLPFDDPQLAMTIVRLERREESP